MKILLFITSIIFYTSTYCNEISNSLKNEIEMKISTHSYEVIDLLIESVNTVNSNTITLCNICKVTTSEIKILLNKFLVHSAVEEALFKIANFICKKFIGLEYEICSGGVHLYGPGLLESVIDKFADPQNVCSSIKICENIYRRVNHTEFAEKILKEKRIFPSNVRSEDNIRIAHISDLHVDHLYLEGSLVNCNQPLCCRKESTPKYTFLNEEIKAGKFGSIGSCDLPKITLDSLIENTFVNPPEIVLLTGDNTAHDTWKTTLSEALENTKYIVNSFTKQMKEKNVNCLIVPTLGNHESKVVDTLDFKNKTYLAELYNSYAEVYAPFFQHDIDALNSFRLNGFYSTKYQNLRIVSLNTYNCDDMNFYLIKNVTDPGNQYLWLENELRASEEKGEYVYLIGHISPSSCLLECALRYKSLSDRFSHIIKGHFYGHSHVDWVQVINQYFDNQKSIGVLMISPSGTTYTNHLPSWREVYINRGNYDVENYFQHRLNITEANESGEAKWFISYKFIDLFNCKLYEIDKVRNKLNSIGIDKDFTALYQYHHTVFESHPLPSEITEDGYKGLKCNSITDNKQDNDDCKNNHKKSLEDKVKAFLFGNWYTIGKNENK